MPKINCKLKIDGETVAETDAHSPNDSTSVARYAAVNEVQSEAESAGYDLNDREFTIECTEV